MRLDNRGAIFSPLLLLAASVAAQPLDSTTRPGPPPGNMEPPFPSGLLRHGQVQGNGCPHDFAQPTPAGAACSFVGTWNKDCRNQALHATFVSNGRQVAVVLEEPFVYFVAGVGDGRDGPLHASGAKPDVSDTKRTDGIVSLSRSGRRLVVAPAPPPFSVRGCDFVQYSGKFVAAGDAASARRAERALGLLRSGRP